MGNSNLTKDERKEIRLLLIDYYTMLDSTIYTEEEREENKEYLERVKNILEVLDLLERMDLGKEIT